MESKVKVIVVKWACGHGQALETGPYVIRVSHRDESGSVCYLEKVDS